MRSTDMLLWSVTSLGVVIWFSAKVILYWKREARYEKILDICALALAVIVASAHVLIESVRVTLPHRAEIAVMETANYLHGVFVGMFLTMGFMGSWPWLRELLLKQKESKEDSH